MIRPGRDDARYRASRRALRRLDQPCAGCGWPIDQQLPYPHPLSWSADHIVPCADLAADDWRRWHISNLRSMHLRCNQSRGAKPISPPVQGGLNTSIRW